MGREDVSSRCGARLRLLRRAASAASLGSVVLLAVCAAGCGGQPKSQPAADPDLPNLVLVSVDTLNRNALRAFDPQAQELPNLDRFADGALRFTQAFSSASWTLPAHASLLTAGAHRFIRSVDAEELYFVKDAELEGELRALRYL